MNWLWSPVLNSTSNAFARHLINGWQLSSSTTLASPLYTTGTVPGPSGEGLLYTGSLNGSGGWSRVPFLPVNSQRIDGEEFVNARISRAFQIRERVKASLLFEGFNVFNTTYATGINTQAYSATGLVLKPVSSFGIGNAAQAFPDGTNARRMQAGLRVEF